MPRIAECLGLRAHPKREALWVGGRHGYPSSPNNIGPISPLRIPQKPAPKIALLPTVASISNCTKKAQAHHV